MSFSCATPLPVKKALKRQRGVLSRLESSVLKTESYAKGYSTGTTLRPQRRATNYSHAAKRAPYTSLPCREGLDDCVSLTQSRQVIGQFFLRRTIGLNRVLLGIK